MGNWDVNNQVKGMRLPNFLDPGWTSATKKISSRHTPSLQFCSVFDALIAKTTPQTSFKMTFRRMEWRHPELDGNFSWVFVGRLVWLESSWWEKQNPVLGFSNGGRSWPENVKEGGGGARNSGHRSDLNLGGVCRGWKMEKNGGGFARFRPVELRENGFLWEVSLVFLSF